MIDFGMVMFCVAIAACIAEVIYLLWGEPW